MNAGLNIGKLWWLLRHEWRLQLRESPNSRWLLWLAVAAIFFAFVGSMIARGFVEQLVPGLPNEFPTSVLGVLSLGVVVLFSILLSLAVRSTVQTLFERGDLDLLLSSPLDTRSVLASRGLWVFASGLMSMAIFVVPVTFGALIVLGWRVLGMLPLLVALALLAAGVGLLLTLGLVRWLGARRAQTVAQVLGVLIGSGFYLVLQLGSRLNLDQFPWLRTFFNQFADLPSNSVWFFPARAMFLEPLPTLSMLGLGLIVFVLSVQLMHRAFLTGATSSMTGGRVRVARFKAARFQRNFVLGVMRKEWRLIARDPMLISQTLMQMVYLIPMAFSFFGGASRSTASFMTGVFPLLAFAVVFLGGSLAQNLTNIVIAAEDAPELLRMSPANGWQIRWAKLFAAIAPAWVLFTPIIVWRAIREPRSLLLFIPFAAVTVLGGLMMLWSSQPFNRSDLLKKRQGQSRIIGFGLLALDIAWLAAVLAPGWWALMAATIGLIIPLLFWSFTRNGSRLAY
jgi:ABC-2 type transport system permease protein